MAKKNSLLSPNSALKRDTSKAGQTVNVGGKSVTYGSDGYVKSAKNDGGAAAAKYASSSGGGTAATGNKTTVTKTVSLGSGSAVKPVSGGSSGTTTTMQGSNVKYIAPSASGGSTDYHQQAKDAAARGDWGAVEAALAARQAKIDAQGGNDRGTSNAQILSQLRSQYGDSWSSQSSGTRDRVSLAAGEKLPFTNYAGTAGNLSKGKGWEDGVDYLDRAKQYAAAGDLDGAYDALMRRGFKMSDTGSQGGGTSQDQAYALVHQLYSQSPGARQTYENNLSANRQRLSEHQTQFGLETRPELAYKQFKSADNKYWIIYDGQGRPVAAKPVGHEAGDGKTPYSREEIDLMSRYYGGAEDWSDLDRQLHNLAVVRTGTGRLVDGAGNFASGTALQPGSAGSWTGLPQTDTNQDTAALRAILDRISTGEISGAPVTVPTLPDRGGSGAGWTFGVTGGLPGAGGYGDDGDYGGGGYGGADLSAYLRELYGGNLDAQLAAMRAAYEQNVAGYQSNYDRIARAYQDQRNQAAAQNDLHRMYMAEMGAMQGLNTGATGQLALAQSAAYQGSLADLLAAESQDRSANDLAMQQLEAGYQGDVAAAAAENKAQLSQALYSEYARQLDAAEAARQAAQAQANWQAQFDYQRQQDALNLQKWQQQFDYQRQQDALSQQAAQQSTAYKMAAAMLENGVMPDSGTLAAAGISAGDAQAYVNAVQAQLAAKTAKSTGRSGGSSDSGKPKLTISQALSAVENGTVTDEVKRTIDYYYGAGAFDTYYGGGSTGGGLPDIRNIDTEQITNAKPNADTVRLSRSNGKGDVVTSWNTVVDGVEKGYVSMTPAGNGKYTLTWLR